MDGKGEKELWDAAHRVLDVSGQTAEYRRRLRKLLENALTANHTDEDVRQVIVLAKTEGERE